MCFWRIPTVRHHLQAASKQKLATHSNSVLRKKTVATRSNSVRRKTLATRSNSVWRKTIFVTGGQTHLTKSPRRDYITLAKNTKTGQAELPNYSYSPDAHLS
jgi:hypothetical protein